MLSSNFTRDGLPCQERRKRRFGIGEQQHPLLLKLHRVVAAIAQTIGKQGQMRVGGDRNRRLARRQAIGEELGDRGGDLLTVAIELDEMRARFRARRTGSGRDRHLGGW